MFTIFVLCRMLAWGWWKTVEEVIYCFTNNQHDILWKLWKPKMVAQLKQGASSYKYLIWICFLRRVDAEHQKCEALRCRRLWMPGNIYFLNVFLWSLFENYFLEKMKKTFQVNTNPLLKHTVTLSVVGDYKKLMWLFYFTFMSCVYIFVGLCIYS